VNLRFSLILFLLASSLAHAQQQERKMEDRIMRPDMTLGAAEQNKGFGTQKSFSSSSSSSSKPFSFLPHFALKGFFSKTYSGSKNYWTGDYQPYARNSNLGLAKAPQGSEKHFETKTMAVSDAREGGKGYAANSIFPTKQGHQEGKSQKALTQETAGKPMSIDEVRDLLNKNK